MLPQHKNDTDTVKRLRLLTAEVAIIILAFIISFGIVLFFIKRIFFLKKDTFDQQVFTYLKSHVSDTNTAIMEVFTWLGSQNFLVPVYVVLMLYSFFVKKDTWLGIKVMAVSISSLAVMFGLKLLFQRPRPMMPLLREVQGLSFPSGHAFMSFSFFGLLIYILHKTTMSRWLKYPLFVIFGATVLIIGISRIYLRVHYASDVITGFCMGFMWMVISLAILHFMEKRKRKTGNTPDFING